MSEEVKKYPAAYRSTLQEAYGVCYRTMRNWLRSVPNVETRYVQHFKPKEVKKIIEHLGEPPNDLEGLI